MQSETGELADELQQVWSEFEKLVGLARATVGEQTEELAGQVRDSLDQAHGELKRRARAVEDYLRENMLAVVALTAATALVVGVLIGRASRSDVARQNTERFS